MLEFNSLVDLLRPPFVGHHPTKGRSVPAATQSPSSSAGAAAGAGGAVAGGAVAGGAAGAAKTAAWQGGHSSP